MCICTNKESKEKKGTCKHTGSGTASTCSCNCDDCLDCRGSSCKKNCKPAAGNLSICKASQGNTLTVGQRDRVSARFNRGYSGNRHIGWRSSNPNVVKVDCYGNLTAVGEGYACIYAYVYGNSSVYDKITIHVTANNVAVDVTSITLSCSTSNSIFVGTAGLIMPSVFPANATNKSLTFSSSNTTVLTCTDTGRYIAKAAGTAVVTVRAASGVTARTTFWVRNCDDHSDPPIAGDTREKVSISKEGDYVTVNFESGAVWKGIGCDMALSENLTGRPMWDPDVYDLLNENERRYLFNTEQEYTVQQLAFLYLIDPFGIEYYAKNYYINHDLSVSELLFFKDELYKEIFGVMPRLFKVFPDKSVSYYEYPKSITGQDREKYYSYAEVLFGEHPIYDLISVVSFLMDVVPQILSIAFAGIWPTLSTISLGIDLCKFLFFSSAAADFIPGAASAVFDEYVATITSEKAYQRFGWASATLSAINVLLEGAEVFVPPIDDITIYDKISAQNFRTNFVIGNSEITIDEILDHCE